jgi:hypothetical protein
MASWKEERDRLVAQTLAFVQHVAAAHPAVASKLRTEPQAAQAVTNPVDEVSVLPDQLSDETIVVSAEDVLSAEEPLPAPIVAAPIVDEPACPPSILVDLPRQPLQYRTASERASIAERVAAFKARQLTLNQEREAYYERMQARIKSSLGNDPGLGRL